jgi:hypothetical protein
MRCSTVEAMILQIYEMKQLHKQAILFSDC